MAKENEIQANEDKFRVVYNINDGEIKSEWTNEMNAHKELTIYSLIPEAEYSARIESLTRGFLDAEPANKYSYCFTCNKKLDSKLKTSSEAWKDCYFHIKNPLYKGHNAQPVVKDHR